jgi:hypothetical protein
LNIRNADIQKAADLIRVGGYAKRYRRLVWGGPAPDIDNQPRIRDLNVPRRTFAVAQAQNAAAEDFFVEGADRAMSATVMKCVTVNPSPGANS